MITVVNRRTHHPTSDDYYVGRGSVLGNIYTCKPLSKTKALHQCETREESIAKYKVWLLDKIATKDVDVCSVLNAIYKHAKYGRVYLVCYCKPHACHADIIKELVESKMK